VFVFIGLQCLAIQVHDCNGTRIACGLLKMVDAADLLVADTSPLSTDGTAKSVNTIYPFNDRVCLFGLATGLEAGLTSVLSNGTDCGAVNECGVHVHSGMSCTNSTTQGGHYYDNATLAADPWKLAGYRATSADGAAYSMSCVETGETSYDGHPLIVHSKNGSRVSCGLVSSAEMNTTRGVASGGAVTINSSGVISVSTLTALLVTAVVLVALYDK
jgi:hypothetical protein